MCLKKERKLKKIGGTLYMSRLNLSKKLIIVIFMAFLVMLVNASFDLIYEYNKNIESLEVLETSVVYR